MIQRFISMVQQTGHGMREYRWLRYPTWEIAKFAAVVLPGQILQNGKISSPLNGIFDMGRQEVSRDNPQIDLDDSLLGWYFSFPSASAKPNA